MGISDLIASFLQDCLDASGDGVLEVQRNDLAQRFNCVPSQINYVMSTRFSPERGYIVESRRGGNGYIRITRVQVDRQTLLMHVINSLGDEIDLPSVRAILGNLNQAGALDGDLARTLLAAVGDKALAAVPRDLRNRVRAGILKNVLILQV
ncbi:MAG: CtsR family transcriptional regulator [Oscillibacter sp.]|nr:CtsR family transcriptional regulator [Oscillibacter sp.]MCI8847976.1 CtsR family transcriptional regulator [Oscillibacter sp.]